MQKKENEAFEYFLPMELNAWVEDPKSAYNNSEEKSEFVQNLRQRF